MYKLLLFEFELNLFFLVVIMRIKWMGVLLVFYMCFLLICGTGVKYYTNKWFAHVPMGEIAARIVARSIDMKYEGPVI